MKKVIEIKESCSVCDGTGLYVGFAESSGAAVVCYKCNGTGCHIHRHEYEDFTVRKKRNRVKRVFAANPGIGIGVSHKLGVSLEDFGGLSFEEWEGGASFKPGTEMRKFTCPAWWYQTADYKLKPEWSSCDRANSFSTCPDFCNKAACWKRWDKEIGSKGRGKK